MKRITLGLVVALVVLWGHTALAQDSLSKANKLIRNGSFDQAIQLLLPEFASNPAAKTAYALGQCYDGIHDRSRAIQFFENALSLKGLTKKQRGNAKRHIKILKKQLQTPIKSIERQSQTPSNNATLSVISNAPNALVRLDGVEIGRIPFSGFLITPGRHTVVVEFPGSKSWTKTFTAKAHSHVRLAARLKDNPNDVLIHTVPAGARATIHGSVTCTTPCLLTLAAGNYKITIQHQAYAPMTRTFAKTSGQLLELNYALLANNSLGIQPLPPNSEPNGPILAPAKLKPLALGTTTERDNSNAWAWMISGGSVLLVGAGLTTGALMLKYKFDMVELLKVNSTQILKSGVSRKDALQWEKNAQIMMYTSYALYGLGAGALIAGWLLYESDDDYDPLTAPGFSVYPVLDSNHVGAAATVRF